MLTTGIWFLDVFSNAANEIPSSMSKSDFLKDILPINAARLRRASKSGDGGGKIFRSNILEIS